MRRRSRHCPGHHLDVALATHQCDGEGVENFPQLAFLLENECQEAQGFLFSRALTAGDAHKLLTRAAAIGEEPTRTARLRSLIG